MNNNHSYNKLIIIHGWADDPTTGWIDWIKNQSSLIGIQAIAPKMPDPKNPNLAKWIAMIEEVAGEIDERTILLGHSLGCFALLRFLESTTSIKYQVGKLILVAGFEKPNKHEVHKYFEPPLNYPKIISRIDKIISIYSDNDKWVAPASSKILADKLSAKKIELSGYGHFAQSEGMNTFPELLPFLST